MQGDQTDQLLEWWSVVGEGVGRLENWMESHEAHTGCGWGKGWGVSFFKWYVGRLHDLETVQGGSHCNI